MTFSLLLILMYECIHLALDNHSVFLFEGHFILSQNHRILQWTPEQQPLWYS